MLFFYEECYTLLNRKLKVEECDATMLNSSNADGNTKNIICSFLIVQKRTKKAHPKTKTARFRDWRFDLAFVLL